MKAGALRHRITVEQLTETQDPSTGAVSQAWTTFAADVPCDVLPLSGREILAAAAADSGQRMRFVIRYGNSVGVVPTMRISHESQLFNITEIVPDPSLRDCVTLIAEAGIRNG
jgi:SPP1 family predicted phage head-tail adaptor